MQSLGTRDQSNVYSCEEPYDESDFETNQSSAGVGAMRCKYKGETFCASEVCGASTKAR
jgi:hypothetical protein